MEEWTEDEDARHPLKDGKWVKVDAVIRENATGIVRVFETSEILCDGEVEPNPVNWTEGNFSCDCNRILFFGYAAGETFGETESHDGCAGEGAYSVRLRNPKTGRVYYSEFEPDE